MTSTFRIVLLGKTGNGKSTVGNAILQNSGFKVGMGMMSETTKTAWGMTVRNGLTYQVTDTPGLCDTSMPESNVYKELAKSVAVAKPGPNVILFVLRADRKFTVEERDAYKTIKKLFSEEINNYLILVFNGIDEFGKTKSIAEQRQAHNEDLEKFLRQPSPNAKALSLMMEAVEGRYIGLNNKTSTEVQQGQIDVLINMMQELVKKNGHAFYRTELTEEINQKVDQLLLQQQHQPPPGPKHEREHFQTRIIKEDVPPGFFKSLAETVRQGFGKVKRAFGQICSLQ